MASVEILGRLCARTVNFNAVCGSSGHGQLSKSELPALLVGLSRVQVLFAQAKYCHDDDSLRAFVAHVLVIAAGFAVDEHWRIVLGKPVLCNMALLAVYEIVSPCVCVKCFGRGLVGHRVCVCCSGSGRARLSARKMAEFCSVDERQWRSCWRDRYESIVKYVQSIESEVNYRVSSNDRNGYISDY